MNMMNKCAKFHKDSVSGKKVKCNLPSAIELSFSADFVYNFKTYASEWCKKSKMTKNSNQGGGDLL